MIWKYNFTYVGASLDSSLEQIGSDGCRRRRRIQGVETSGSQCTDKDVQSKRCLLYRESLQGIMDSENSERHGCHESAHGRRWCGESELVTMLLERTPLNLPIKFICVVMDEEVWWSISTTSQEGRKITAMTSISALSGSYVSNLLLVEYVFLRTFHMLMCICKNGCDWLLSLSHSVVGHTPTTDKTSYFYSSFYFSNLTGLGVRMAGLEFKIERPMINTKCIGESVS